jgi:hypothetical protein
MSITLDLPPKIEALLRERAQSTGQDISQMAIAFGGHFVPSH